MFGHLISYKHTTKLSHVIWFQNFPFLRRTALFRWLSDGWCCKKKENSQNQFTNGRLRSGPRNLNQNYDSMRTFTTSLTVTSRRSTCLRPNRVVIVEHQKTILATQEEVSDVDVVSWSCKYFLNTDPKALLMLTTILSSSFFPLAEWEMMTHKQQPHRIKLNSLNKAHEVCWTKNLLCPSFRWNLCRSAPSPRKLT